MNNIQKAAMAVALAALFAPLLARTFGWTNVLGLALIPLAIAFVVYLALAKDAPEQPQPKKLSSKPLTMSRSLRHTPRLQLLIRRQVKRLVSRPMSGHVTSSCRTLLICPPRR